MPERSRKRPTDINALAASIVGDATDEDKPDPDAGKDPAAVALGRKGGLKGGPARAERMSAQERSTTARLAAQARWQRHGGDRGGDSGGDERERTDQSADHRSPKTD